MKKISWIFLGIGLVVILLMSGLTAFTFNDTVRHTSRNTKALPIWPSEKMLQVQDELLRINSEPHLIMEIIQGEVEQWSAPTKTKAFKMVNRLDLSQQVVGLYHTPTEWELTGNIDVSKRFQMTSQNNTVTLVYDQEETTLAGEEFSYLLPLHHLRAIEEVLQSENAQQIVWQKGKEYWYVTIQSPLRSISNEIHYFLFHGSDAKAVIDKSLADFELQYTLAFSIDEDRFILKSFQFNLDKQLKPVNQLEFFL